ncbi:MAG: hypothetical protein AB9835_05015 [Eubacteriales bacterium]
MPNYKVEHISGDIYEAELFFSPRKRGKQIPRSKNINLTSAQQQEVNLRQARKKLSRLINTNFTKKDMFITLTYRDEPDSDEAKKDLPRFVRRLRLQRRNMKLPDLKWIAVTEGGHDEEYIKTHKHLHDHDPRLHHHVIISGGVSLEALQEMWEHGTIIASMLSSEREYTGLAHYITKEPKEKHKKRWSQSRNLEKPKVVVKEIKSPRHEFKAPRGYVVLVQELYVSEMTGVSQYMKAIRRGGVDIALGKEALEKDDPSPKRGKQRGPVKSKSKPAVVKSVLNGEKSTAKAEKTETKKDTAEKVKSTPDSMNTTKMKKTRQSKKGGEKH